MFTEHVQSRGARRADSRRRVLQAADQLFRTRGFPATTVRDIAAAASVSTGTVMSVGDKDALLVSVFDDWIGQVHRNREGGRASWAGGVEVDRANAGDAVGAVCALFTPFLEYFGRDPDLSRTYAAIIVRGSHPSPIFVGLRETLIAEITDILHAAQLADAGKYARAIYFGYLGILLTAPTGTELVTAVADEVRELVETVIGGRDRAEGERS